MWDIIKKKARMVVAPVQAISRDLLYSHQALWNREFWEVWEPLPLDKKLIWMVFLTNTVSAVTLFELLIFQLFK